MATLAQYATLAKFTTTAAAILNLNFWPYLGHNEDINIKLGVQIDIGHTRIIIAQHISLLIKFKMAASAIFDSFLRHISLINEDICVKLGMLRMVIRAQNSNLVKFKMKYQKNYCAVTLYETA